MKIFIIALISLFALTSANAQKEKIADSSKISEPGYEMKQYWFIMLVRGTNRNHDSATAAKIQEGHMANINKLASTGKLMLAGPFGDNGNWRGIFILDCKDQAEAEDLLKTDPAISSGRLAYEIHPWWTAKNEVFK